MGGGELFYSGGGSIILPCYFPRWQLYSNILLLGSRFYYINARDGLGVQRRAFYIATPALDFDATHKSINLAEICDLSEAVSV